MIKLPYDPADGAKFWEKIRKLPGFPVHETMPIKHMIFESDALFKTTEILKSIGASQKAPLVVVMDETSMHRNGADLKSLALNILRKDGWQVRVCNMLSDESGQVHTDMPHIQLVQESSESRLCCSLHWVGRGNGYCQAWLFSLSAGNGREGSLRGVPNSQQRQRLYLEHVSHFCGWSQAHA